LQHWGGSSNSKYARLGLANPNQISGFGNPEGAIEAVRTQVFSKNLGS
jgi:hypothetical protein